MSLVVKKTRSTQRTPEVMPEALKPLLINPYKHHFGTILEFIQVQREEKSKAAIRNVLNKIGNSQMDEFV